MHSNSTESIIWEGRPSWLNLFPSIVIAGVILFVTWGFALEKKPGAAMLGLLAAGAVPGVHAIWLSGTKYRLTDQRLTIEQDFMGTTVSLKEAELHKVTDWRARSSLLHVLINIPTRRGYGTLTISTRERYEARLTLGIIRDVYTVRDILRNTVETRKGVLHVHRHEDLGNPF